MFTLYTSPLQYFKQQTQFYANVLHMILLQVRCSAVLGCMRACAQGRELHQITCIGGRWRRPDVTAQSQTVAVHDVASITAAAVVRGAQGQIPPVMPCPALL